MTKRKYWISNRLFPGSRLRWILFFLICVLFSGEIARVNSCSQCLCLCVWGGQNLKLLTVYLNRLCSLIHGWYCMLLVTRFRSVEPNADTRHGGRWYVMGNFNDYSLKEVGGLQIMWWRLGWWIAEEGWWRQKVTSGRRQVNVAWWLTAGDGRRWTKRWFFVGNWWTGAGQSFQVMRKLSDYSETNHWLDCLGIV